MRIAIDTGGTFTDCVYVKDGSPAVLKVLSTPDDPARSVLEAVRQITARVGAAQGSHPPRVSRHATEARPPRPPVEVRHGTTIGTNALLERKGARVAFVTTAGFEDTIAIGRQARQHLYDWMATPKPCLVPAELRFGVRERVSAEGEILLAPAKQELSQLCERICSSDAASVAISLLFSFANPDNEKRVVEALTSERVGAAHQGSHPARFSPDGTEARPTDSRTVLSGAGPEGHPYTSTLPISVSYEILPELREYERAATVVVNAYLAPKAGGYLQKLESAIQSEHGGSLYVMQSSGGIISGNLAAAEPVRTVLSGPAGGVIGAYRVAKLAGFDNIIGFDMGGTSTDVAVIDAAGPRTTSEGRVSEIPISVPMLDIHTVGAGGGSLAWFDRGGILHVGPASAGADPGPICYGRGETPTVTDANLILGRLDPGLSLAGTVHLDQARTRQFMEKTRTSVGSVEEFAAGIVRLAETEMEKAIRLISVERGYDPREFTLVCFGGAGPLHACSLARALGIPRVLVPAMPGALSALGILMSDVVRDYSRTVMIPFAPEQPPVPSATLALPLRSLRSKAFNRRVRRDYAEGAEKTSDDAGSQNLLLELEPYFADLESKATSEFQREGFSGIATRSIDLRYAGQGYELNVPFSAQMLNDFHAAHRKRYGHADESRTVEIVNVRLRMIASSEEIDLPRQARGCPDCSRAIVKRKAVIFGDKVETPVYGRDLLVPGNRLESPSVVHEYSATTVIPPGASAHVDEHFNIVIEV